jgi:dihydroorotate dehydrogenase electron transfer subunit
MRIEKCIISRINKITSSVVTLSFNSEYFSKNLNPGQFVNIKIDNERSHILRRPFSVSDINAKEITILFNIVGKGTFSLSEKKVGDDINIVGPLGNGFNYNSGITEAVIIGGGIGVAPFPFLIRKLVEKQKNVNIYFGYKTKDEIIDFGFENIHISTDDGSFGFKGNVIELLMSKISNFNLTTTKIFACGPNIMLKNLSDSMSKLGFETEVSIESYMACGIGICQGCPVESRTQNDRYFLVCKDGPCFNIKDINL